MRWIFLLIALNALLLGGICRRVWKGPVLVRSYSQVEQPVETRRVLFDGAEVVREDGGWYFHSPQRWPAISSLMESEIWAWGLVGEVVHFPSHVHWQDFLDPHLLRIHPQLMRRMRLGFGDQVLFLEHGGDCWRLTCRGHLNEIALRDWLHFLKKLTFMSRDGALPPSAAPSLSLDIESNFAAQSQRLEFFSDGEKSLVRVDGSLIFALGDGTGEEALAHVQRLRSRRFFPHPPANSLVLLDGDSSLLLKRERSGDAWVVLPTGKNRELRPASDGERELLRRISELEWEKIICEQPRSEELEARGLANASRSIRVDGQRVAWGRCGGETQAWDEQLRAIVDVGEGMLEELFAAAFPDQKQPAQEDEGER